MAESDRNSYSSEIRLLNAKTARIKGWGAIIAIVATNLVTLVTAVSAYIKVPPEAAAKAAYKELSGAIKQISEQQVEMQNDVANIRGYLDGIAKQPYLMKEHDGRSLNEIVADSLEKESGKASRRGRSGKKPRGFIARPDVPKKPPKMTAKPKPYIPPSLDSIKKE